VLAFWYTSTNTDARCSAEPVLRLDNKKKLKASKEAEQVRSLLVQKYLLYWYKSTNTDT
jgi:hypothetical protein